MKKVFKTMVLMLCFLLVVPVLTACKDKQLVLSQVQTSQKTIERGESVSFRLTYGGEQIENPDIRIVYDSHAQEGNFSAEITEGVLTIAQDAEIGAVVKVQAFYNKQNSNVLEFVVTHKSVDNIAFVADDITHVGGSEYETVKQPGDEITLQDVVQILPEYASHIVGGETKPYTIADLTKFEIKAEDPEQEQYFQTIGELGNINLGVKVLENAPNGYAFTIHIALNEVEASLKVSIGEQKPTISWKNTQINVYHGTSINLEDLINFNPGNGQSVSVEFVIDSFSSAEEGLEEVFLLDNKTLTIATYTSNKTLNTSCVIKAKVVGLSGDEISATATFTIKPNKLDHIEIKPEYVGKNIDMLTSTLYDLKDYIVLVGENPNADVTEDVNGSILDIVVTETAGIQEDYILINATNLQFGIKPFSNLDSNNKILKVQFFVKSTQKTSELTFSVSKAKETIKLHVSGDIGEIDGSTKDIFAGTYTLSFVCYKNDSERVDDVLCENITLALKEGAAAGITFDAENNLTVGEDVASETTFTIVYKMKDISTDLVTFTVKNSSSLVISMNPEGILGGTGTEEDPYLVDTQYAEYGPVIIGNLLWNGVSYDVATSLGSLSGLTFTAKYTGFENFIDMTTDWGKFNMDPVQAGGKASVYIEVTKTGDGSNVCTSNTLHFNFIKHDYIVNEAAEVQMLLNFPDVSEIYLKEGSYRFSNPMMLTQDISFIGLDENVILVFDNLVTIDLSVNVTIQNVTIQGACMITAIGGNLQLHNVLLADGASLEITGLSEALYNQVKETWNTLYTVQEEVGAEGTFNITLTKKVN